MPGAADRTDSVTGDVAADGKSFDAEFTANEGFEFKPAPYMYRIEYKTCATTDGLPEAGETFTNEATVDGVSKQSTAKTPGRSEGKSGGVNGSAKELDGETYPAQTTMNWSVTVPGQNVDGLTGELTLTDELSGPHQVCGDGAGDVTERIGLKVEARDQISPNGGLTTQTLDATGVLEEDGTLTITIDEPTLPLPGGGESAGFSREYQYVTMYTTCTTSGGMDAQGTAYSNSVSVAGKSYETTATQNNRGSGSGSGVARGSVSVSKSIADTSGAAFVADGTEFTVHVKEIEPGGSIYMEYDLSVPLNGDPVDGLNSRGNGWTIELSEPSFPSVPGVTFGAPKFAEADGVTVSEDGTVATAALLPRSNIAVTVENTALLGSLDVTKALEGPAADQVDPNRLFELTAHIDTSALGAGFPAQPDRTFTLKAGETVTLNDLPIGAIVTITETQPVDDDTFTWAPYAVAPEAIVVSAEHAAEPATFTVTNTVDRTYGTFSLAKDVTGEQAENPAVPETVEVTATWVDAEGVNQEKVLLFPTNGEPIDFGESLLIGTTVTLVETPLADGSSIAWGAPVWTGTGVEIDDDGNAVVTIVRDVEAAVQVENHAATSVAGISIIKGVAGEAAGEVPTGTEFPVTASWVDAEGQTQSVDLVITDTEPTPLGVDLPAGTVVTITEGERPGFDTVIWGDIVFSGDDVTDNRDGSAPAHRL